MDDGDELRSAPVGSADLNAAFALPIDILLEVVSHTDVVSAIQLTQVNVFVVVLGPRNVI
jgi:hypothetical protein